MLENWAKMKIFFWHCGFSGQKQRFFGRPPPDFRPFPGACLGMARIGLIFAAFLAANFRGQRFLAPSSLLKSLAHHAG